MHLPGFSPGHPLLVQSLELGPLGGSPTPGGQRLSGGHRASGKHGATLICKPSQASLSGMAVRVIGGCPRRATHHLSQHTLPTREVLLDLTVGTAGPREGRRVGQRRQTPAWVFLRVSGGTKAPGRLPLPGLHIQQVAAPVAPLCPLASPSCKPCPGLAAAHSAWAAAGCSPTSPHWPPEGPGACKPALWHLPAPPGEGL